VSVPELFGALRGALKPLLANPAVELVFECAPELPALFTDEAKLTQILRNLISNALKFTEAGEVHVTATHDENSGRVFFRVRDTGIGIAAEDHARIFEEFGQLDTRMHRRVKGTGLGLPLSLSLARLLGGDLTVESVVGQGSVFSLSLPMTIGSREAIGPGGGDPGRRHRVLVIDDEETFRYVFRQLIATEPAYDMIEAADADEGLRRARAECPDLILLDLHMPGVDGFTLLQEFKVDPAFTNIPVVISTSLTVNPDLLARLPAGIPILSKSDLSRESVGRILSRAVRNRLA
jgi:CheY-like chemotaxis protein